MDKVKSFGIVWEGVKLQGCGESFNSIFNLLSPNNLFSSENHLKRKSQTSQVPFPPFENARQSGANVDFLWFIKHSQVKLNFPWINSIFGAKILHLTFSDFWFILPKNWKIAWNSFKVFKINVLASKKIGVVVVSVYRNGILIWRTCGWVQICWRTKGFYTATLLYCCSFCVQTWSKSWCEFSYFSLTDANILQPSKTYISWYSKYFRDQIR